MTVQTLVEKPIHTYKMELITLAPVFIGSGESVAQSMYFQENGKLFIVNESKLAQCIASSTNLIEQYKTLLSEIASAKNENQSQGDQSNLYHFLKQNSHIRKELELSKGISCYSLRKATSLTGDIKLFYANHNSCYIPGSSIKGAIRTLILRHLLRKMREERRLEPKSINASIELDYLRGFSIDKKLGKTAVGDFMRAIHVSDSRPIPYSHFECLETMTFNMQKKIQPKQFTSMKITQICLKPDTHIQFVLSFDQQMIKQFDSLNQKNSLEVPFKNSGDLLTILAKETDYLKEDLSRNIDLAEKRWPKDKDFDYIYTSENEDLESLPANFYLGANTGFDRHTVWTVFPDEEVKNLKIREGKLPKLRTHPNAKKPPLREEDSFVPRCIRSVQSYHDTTHVSFGWCHLRQFVDKS